MIRLMGSEVWALTLHDENLDSESLQKAKNGTAETSFGIPVFIHSGTVSTSSSTRFNRARMGGESPMRIDRIETWKEPVPLTRPYSISSRTITMSSCSSSAPSPRTAASVSARPHRPKRSRERPPPPARQRWTRSASPSSKAEIFGI